MRQTPPEVVLATLVFIVFWVVVVVAVLIARRRWERMRPFSQAMMAQWKPSLAIATLYLVGTVLGGRSVLNPYAVAVFCQAMIGLALARGITGYEPLPASQSIRRRQRPIRETALMLVVAVVAIVPALLVGGIGMSVGSQLLGEVPCSSEAVGMFPADKWSVFFLLLSGAGIAEETAYRLVCLSFVWRVTRRPWLAVVASAVLFGAYHLSPLSGMYQTFWQYPVSQFLGSTLVGVVWGILYVKRGYETAVLSHTFQDWLPFALFA